MLQPIFGAIGWFIKKYKQFNQSTITILVLALSVSGHLLIDGKY